MIMSRKEFKQALIKQVVTATSKSIVLKKPYTSKFELKYQANNNYNFMLFFQHKKEGIFLNIKPTGEVYFRVRLLYPYSLDSIKELDTVLIGANTEYTKDQLNEVISEFKMLYKKYSNYLFKQDYNNFNDVCNLLEK